MANAVFPRNDMTSVSKTDVPCDCGWLCWAINDPQSGVKYDVQNNWLVIGESYLLYHCPFCGGRYPDSSKPMWVPIIPSGERERLESMISNLNSREDILRVLGKPDIDVLTYAFTEESGNVRRSESPTGIRNIEFYGLSEWFNIEFYVDSNGMTTHKLVMKLLSPRPKAPPYP